MTVEWTEKVAHPSCPFGDSRYHPSRVKIRFEL
jgi:hypothetical protein